MNWLWQLYQPFFDLQNWSQVFESQKDVMLILTLIIMECLLSVDNAVVLAAQTQQLPTKKLQQKALMYGLVGAYVFRFIIIGLGTYLINWWQIKVFGAAYLLYLGISFFLKPQTQAQPQVKKRWFGLSLFWQTVISLEIMDIVFSIDSVLASLAISNNPVIVLVGGLIGILAMREVAQLIARLMTKIPELNPMAYILIIIIGLKLLLSIPMIDIEIPDLIFAGIVFGVIGLTLVWHYLKITLKKRS